jgi:hypothetical protein
MCEFGTGCSLSLKMKTQHGHWVEIESETRQGLDDFTPVCRVRVTFGSKPSEAILKALRPNFTYCPSNQTWYSRKQRRVTTAVGHLVDKLVRCNFVVVAYLVGTPKK